MRWMEGWSVLLCATDDADATALAFVKTAIERRDDLLEAVTERAWDWHDGGSNRGGDRPPSLGGDAAMMSPLHSPGRDAPTPAATTSPESLGTH